MEKPLFKSTDSEGSRLVCMLEPAEGYESEMLCRLKNQLILRPRIVYSNGKRIYSYDLMGMEPLVEHLTRHAPGAVELRGFLMQVWQCIEEVRNHMLTENNLVFDPEYLYVGKTDGLLRPAAVPQQQDLFCYGIRLLLNELLLKADTGNEETLRLAYELFRLSLAERFTPEDLLAVADRTELREHADPLQPLSRSYCSTTITPDSAAPPALFNCGETGAALLKPQPSSAFSADSLLDELYPADDPVLPDFHHDFDPSALNRKDTQNGQGGEHRTGHFIKKCLFTFLILAAGPVAAFLIRGYDAFLRILPAAGVMAAAFCVYHYFKIFKS